MPDCSKDGGRKATRPIRPQSDLKDSLRKSYVDQLRAHASPNISPRCYDDSRAFHLALGSTRGPPIGVFEPLTITTQASRARAFFKKPRKWSQRIPPPRVIAPKTSLSHVFQAHCTATLAALYRERLTPPRRLRSCGAGGIGLDVQPNLGSTYSRATRPAALPGDSELFRGAQPAGDSEFFHSPLVVRSAAPPSPCLRVELLHARRKSFPRHACAALAAVWQRGHPYAAGF
ncbi:hypothetical protein GGX14DRAFT_566423 [Mycena pura]|uniref:Uncharacterized protein n=1 Tax=Mycena pura TaxID=153505 RepID=A0AAD6Y9V5_9AGAR|nr:hypothetical protein GGX14DRAFT_566423 [Mycena pura]